MNLTDSSRQPSFPICLTFLGLLFLFSFPLDLQAREDSDLRSAYLAELEAQYRLSIPSPETFTTADLRSLLRGAQALPRAAWHILDQPFQIEYQPRPCLFGMGRYTDHCPTFHKERRRGTPTTFYIYQTPPLIGDGPVETMSILTAKEQRDIQLRRAVVHLVMVHLDQEFQWSSSPQWRSINGWPRRTGNALNLDPWGYSRILGIRSPHLDLITFAEEFFVRPEDLLLELLDSQAHHQAAADTITQRLALFDPDLSVTCQQFTKRRALNQMLLTLDPTWEEPLRPLPHIEAGGPLCPAFEQWARPDLLDGFDVLLAAATSNQPESLYGHLLLHVRYRSDGLIHSTGFEPVYQFGAVTDTNVSPVAYFTRGLFGGFPSILELNTLRGIDRIFLQYQQRSLQRYSLRLSPDEGRHFLERIWEGERRLRYPYVFLPHNCASFLVDLLSPVVDPELFERQSRIVMPTDVLDTLSTLSAADGKPLLEKRPDALRSNREIAEEAILERRELIPSLATRHQQRFAEVYPSRSLSHELASLLAAFEDPDPNTRREAFKTADTLFRELLAIAPESADTLIDFIYTGVLIERYFMELANFARRAVYLRTGSPPAHQSIAEILASRRALYQHENIEARIASFNENSAQQEGLLRRHRRRDFTPEEEAILDEEANTRRTYLQALQIQSQLIVDHIPDWNGVAYLESRSQRYAAEMERLDALAIGPSGRNRFTLGAAFDPITGLPSLELSFSAIEDRLGEIRRRGYPGNLESRVFGLDATIPLETGSFSGLLLDLTIFRYLSIERSYAPIRTGLLDNLGWGVDVSILHDGRRDLLASIELTPSLLFPLWSGRDHVHHLVLETSLAFRHDIHAGSEPHLGLRAALFGQLHLYGDYANTLRFGFHTAHYLKLGPDWAYDLGAHIQTRHHLFTIGQKPLLAIPFLEASRTTRTYDGNPSFDSLRAGLKVELPF